MAGNNARNRQYMKDHVFQLQEIGLLKQNVTQTANK